MALYDSIIACFGARFTIVLMPNARRYRVHPLGTFHYFDWQKTDTVGISMGTCPQVVLSETAQIGVRVGDVSRMLPFDTGETFAAVSQQITPLTTVFEASDPALPVQLNTVFRSAFYPQSFEESALPGYCVEFTLTNITNAPVESTVFFGLPMANVAAIVDGFYNKTPVRFPDGIDHSGIDNLTVQQILAGDGFVPTIAGRIERTVSLAAGEQITLRLYHISYIDAPTLNQKGNLLRFGYTTLWKDIDAVLTDWRNNHAQITRRGKLFESTVTDATVPPALKLLLAAAFKGVAANAWWAEHDWFSVMEIGAYHATLDVDFQMALFFFQYWPDLLRRMLDQWADYYTPGSGFMAHDVGQHLEATGNRYGGAGSAMKVEENCNYLTLLHAYWRATGDETVFDGKTGMIHELIAFLLAADTTGSGLPNQYADNTNDWGSGLITASEEQSYHGVRLIAAYKAVVDMAALMNLDDLLTPCTNAIHQIRQTMKDGWQHDHYPISFADPASYHHYSMWTAHGLLYPLRRDDTSGFDLQRLRTDVIVSTRRTLREHGSVHSTADVRGWLTQNLWRDSIAAYLGIDMSDNLTRYLGHGEYVSYEDTTILEVANELMVVPGAVAAHTDPDERHTEPMIDGHPRPACGFGLLYALAGITYDAVAGKLGARPVVFPLRVAVTHLADWEAERIPWLTFTRSVPNQDNGYQPATIHFTAEAQDLLTNLQVKQTDPFTPERRSP